jgi:hypothetical protein
MPGRFESAVDAAILAAFEGGEVPPSVDDALSKENIPVDASDKWRLNRVVNVSFGTAQAVRALARELDAREGA